MKPNSFWMRKLHPEVEKFWIDAGYKIEVAIPSYTTLNVRWCVAYYAYKNNGYTFTIAVSETINGPTGKTVDNCNLTYFLNNKSYTLDNILKAIKLKVFI